MPDLTAIQVRALEAAKACSPLIETTIGIDPDTGLDNGGEVECHKCHGTGRVYVLDSDGEFGLRVKCQECATPGMYKGPWASTCKVCSNCRYTPSGDMAAWMRALRASKIGFVIGLPAKWEINSTFFAAASVDGVEGDCIENDDPELAFYTAVAEEVEAIGVEQRNES